MIPLITCCYVVALVVSAPVRVVAQKAAVHRDSAVFASATVVPLRNGANSVDVLGAGTAATVFVARRDNGNAHGYRTVAFYVRTPGDSAHTAWHVVPFFGASAASGAAIGAALYRTEEGADCTLSDLRVLRPRAGGPVAVVIAHRTLGRSYADAAPVRFEVYGLRRNADGAPGWPAYYFRRDRVLQASRPYCDVNEAFARELGLGGTGIVVVDSAG